MQAIWKDTLVNESCHFGIVDMGRLEVSQIGSMFNELWNTDAIIFDIRNYPNGTLWYLVDYQFTSSIYLANFTVPDIKYPGRLEWAPTSIGYGTTAPYQGKIIILFDERTQSQAEYTCMGLERFPGAIKIGSTTSAADGNVAKMYLPGQITAYATFLGTFYPDYTPTQRVGIIPDYEVLPTIEGIRANKDEVMEYALQCALVGQEEIELSDQILLYPNPVVNELIYELDLSNPRSIEIYDLQGSRLIASPIPDSKGKLNIDQLPAAACVVKVLTEDATITQLIIKQ